MTSPAGRIGALTDFVVRSIPIGARTGAMQRIRGKARNSLGTQGLYKRIGHELNE